MARAGFPRRPLASALALALCLVGVSALVAPAPALAPGARAFAGAAHRRACARPPAARGRRRGLRTLVGYEPGGGTVMTPEQVAKVLETSADAPRLPACLSLEDRETRIRLAQILRQGTAVELIQQQFSDAVKDIGMHLGRDVSQALLKAEQEVGGKGFARLSSTNARLSSLNPDVLPPDLRPRKPRIVVLGSGWGAHAFVKVIDTSKFDVVAVSPRPYFIFTPMLASSAVGTVEYRSITEPMRSSNPLVEYFEAAALKIDAASKTVFCESRLRTDEAPGQNAFRVPYDYLVVSIGMEPSTFGVPGVKEYCHFLKEVDDARALRAAIVAKFEAASLPTLSDEERQRLLTFVVVGGGPTGVEFSGELFDFLQQDVKRYYPKLTPLVRTKILQSGKGVLETFDKNMQDMALTNLKNSGVEVILNARVTALSETEITFVQGTVTGSTDTLIGSTAGGGGGGGSRVETLPYGVCVWACGNSARPLSRDLIQTHQATESTRPGNRILVDPWLRMVGVLDGSVFALGDCAEGEEGPLPQTAQVAAQQGAFVAHTLNDEIGASPDQVSRFSPKVWEAIREGVAQGDPVATALSESKRPLARPFEFLSLGILAYVGNRRAIAQVEVSSGSQDEDQQLISFNQAGVAGWILWRSVYLTKQVAFRNRVLVLFDWVKSQIFGRDIACL